MVKEEVGVGAFEHDDGNVVVLFDFGEELVKFDDHQRVDEVDGRVVERDPPQCRVVRVTLKRGEVSAWVLIAFPWGCG